ncbi:MAG TPA: ATPase domain-containing protein [Candidatus Nitrosopolaris sp.]|nr:ATPase domain-containing protein [Candidatus Nitrosopolaris sp.]
MQIPGISALIEKGSIPESLLLLTGPIGAGKTMYCRQFLVDGLLDRDYCIYVSSSLTNKQFRTQFSNIENLNLIQNSKFINPYLHNGPLDKPGYSSFSRDSSYVADNKDAISGLEKSEKINRLSLTLAEIEATIIHINKSAADDLDHNSGILKNIDHDIALSSTGNRGIRVVVDSLTHLFTLFGEEAVLKFINELSFLLKNAEAMAIFTLTSPLSNEYLTNALSSIFDGIIEMKIEDHHGSLARSIRLISIKGVHHKPSWIYFNIDDDGCLSFVEDSSSVTCTLCGKAIMGTPILDSEFSFDSQTCLQTYKKLSGVYGSNISEIGLPSEVVNVNFFFIDIVSLSDPSLSVKKQIEKIGILNKIIGSCETYFKTPKDKKIILPTGDGMAIGFLLSPESPFRLSIELHRKLRIYNRGKSNEDVMGVRIGLSSGPVFIVNDINNNQNVWGPGIILARRVMDIGDNFHILLADRLAEELIGLKDEYRATIKYVVDYQVKHGQRIKLYSAYSKEFGNPKQPSKVDLFYR